MPADFKIAIIGSGPAGLSAAAHAAKKGVSHVLLVELEHLELGQQQLGQRDRGVVDSQPLGQRDGVAHAEGANEHVDLATVSVVVEEQALLALERIERGLGLIVGLLEEANHSRAVLASADEVQIAEVAPEDLGDVIAGPQPDGDAAQEAQLEAVRGQHLQQPLGFVDRIDSDHYGAA